ncbi:MAG: NAD(+)/NADH kinase [Proteobacteria bacterium]|nr:NAD(+)/NADH kinase [Pseudomonadota bacterium]
MPRKRPQAEAGRFETAAGAGRDDAKSSRASSAKGSGRRTGGGNGGRRPRSAPRVLVIYKKSAYQVYACERKDARMLALLEAGHPAVSRLRSAHEHHVRTMAEAKALLSGFGAKAVFRYRSDAQTADSFDLVATLGGDGTLLWASHFVGPSCPILAINTAPGHSVGFLCAGTREHLHELLSGALTGSLEQTRLTRMQVDIDGRTVCRRVLNDALFSHECPAATTRYLLRLREIEEEHWSSGIWVGPAAGSTAALRAAGGRVLPLSSKRLQFVVREPYDNDGEGYRLTKGLVAPSEELRICSKVRAGRLYLDGPRRVHAIQLGSEISVKRSTEPLILLGYQNRAGASRSRAHAKPRAPQELATEELATPEPE